MEIAQDARPTKREGVIDELLTDGSLVLYDRALRSVVTLNPLAAYIWECCTGAQDVRAMIAEARAIFPDTPHVEADVLAFLGELWSASLIVLPAPDHANR